jgi:hypothetical protein
MKNKIGLDKQKKMIKWGYKMDSKMIQMPAKNKVSNRKSIF